MSFLELESIFPVLKVYSMQQTSPSTQLPNTGKPAGWSYLEKTLLFLLPFLLSPTLLFRVPRPELKLLRKKQRKQPHDQNWIAMPGQEDKEPPIWCPRDIETNLHTAKCPLWWQKPFPNLIPFYFDSKLPLVLCLCASLWVTETQCLTTGTRRLCSVSLGSMRSLRSTRAPGHGACCPC